MREQEKQLKQLRKRENYWSNSKPQRAEHNFAAHKPKGASCSLKYIYFPGECLCFVSAHSRQLDPLDWFRAILARDIRLFYQVNQDCT